MPYAAGGVSDPEGKQQGAHGEAAAAAETENMVRGQWLLNHELSSFRQLVGIPSGILPRGTAMCHVKKNLPPVYLPQLI